MVLDTPEIDWKPELSVLMQEMEPGIYQEVQNSSDTTDSLVIQSEPLQASSLAAHLQQAINQLKADPNYKISREKTKKLTIKGELSSFPALLKTYRITAKGKRLELAQLFVAEGERVRLLSYASTRSAHTKRFIKALNSLKLKF